MKPGAIWSERRSATANAQRELPPMLSAYFAAVREALSGKHSPARLHRIRLVSKKVRYTLELFRGCYPAAGFDARLKAMKDVQTSLGDVNDAVATWKLLSKMLPHSPRRTELHAFLKQRAREKADEFRHHWTEEFDAPGRERWWTEFLEGKDGKPNQTALRGNRTRRRPPRQAGA